MDLDQFVEQFKQDLTPQPPTIAAPGTEVNRRVPIRAPSIGADVGVVFCWAMGSGFFVFLLAAFFSLAIEWPLGGALVCGAIAAIIVWFGMMVDWKELLIAKETIKGPAQEVSGDASQPATHFTLPTGPGSFRIGKLDYPPELVINWCNAAWNRQSLSYSAWESHFALPGGIDGRERYLQFRTTMVKKGFAEEVGGNIGFRPCWKNPDAVKFIGGFAQVRPEDGTPLLEGAAL